MVNLPDNIDDWTIGTITDILHEGYYETNTLEFKVDISPENGRIGKTCCAFANTNDGVMIFGVSDDRNAKPMDRIIGLENNQDNIVKITNQMKNIILEIPLENIIFSKSPIKYNDREIILLKIIKTPILHQYDEKFYKRLTGTNTIMAYDEIKDGFISNRKNRRALSLLSMDLGLIRSRLDDIGKDTLPMVESIGFIVNLLNSDTLKHFLYNEAHLYEIELQSNIYRIIEIVQKLKNSKIFYSEGKKQPAESFKSVFEQEKVKSLDELVIKLFKSEALDGLKHIENIEKILEIKIEQPIIKKLDKNKESE